MEPVFGNGKKGGLNGVGSSYFSGGISHSMSEVLEAYPGLSRECNRLIMGMRKHTDLPKVLTMPFKMNKGNP